MSTNIENNIDAITASVLQRRVDAIAKEMATMLMRSSRSPIFNEIGDLVTVVFDKDGNTLAQAEFAAIIAFGAHPALEYIINYYGDDIHEGDVIIHNDVYHGGNQNADTGIFMPIFSQGQLVGWTAAKGHMADIGGMTAGGYDPNARDIWQEALRIPPVKVAEKGVFRKDVWDFISANIRFDFVMEDVKSMIGCCTIGGRRLGELIERYTLPVYENHMNYILESSARQVRAGGEVIELKPKEFDLLLYLARHPGVVLSRDALLREVWGYAFPVDTRTIDVHIRGIRQKIEQDASQPTQIETVRGYGYRFAVPVPRS